MMYQQNYYWSLQLILPRKVTYQQNHSWNLQISLKHYWNQYWIHSGHPGLQILPWHLREYLSRLSRMHFAKCHSFWYQDFELGFEKQKTSLFFQLTKNEAQRMINGSNLARAAERVFLSGGSFGGFARKPNQKFKSTNANFISSIKSSTAIPAMNATINFQVGMNTIINFQIKLSANNGVLLMMDSRNLIPKEWISSDGILKSTDRTSMATMPLQIPANPMELTGSKTWKNFPNMGIALDHNNSWDLKRKLLSKLQYHKK